MTRAAIKSYEDLLVWQKGQQLALLIYQITRSFTDEERFGLTTQMRRAAVSIPCNIAEGWDRRTKRDYRRFVQIARGSTYERKTQVLLANRLRLLQDPDRIIGAVEEIERKINGLLRSLPLKRNER
jgi:four helix bundle protein